MVRSWVNRMLELISPFIVPVMIAFAIGAILYVVLMPFLGGERAAEKRMQGVAGGKTSRTVRTGASAEDLSAKKKQVQDNLKELEKKQKAKNKVTMKVRLLRAGLETSPRQFYITSAILGLIALGAGLIFLDNKIYAFPLAFAAGFGVPRWVVRFLSKRRMQRS